MKTKLFLIIWGIMALCDTSLKAQNLSLTWAKPKESKVVTFDALGNIYTMESYSFSKSDALGNIIWTQSIGSYPTVDTYVYVLRLQ